MSVVKKAKRLARSMEGHERAGLLNLAFLVVHGHYPWQDSSWVVNWVDYTC